jgi:hypothetical protein
MSGRFIKIYEKKKAKWKTIYIGRATSESEEIISGVFTTEKEPDTITAETFDKEDHIIEECCESEVIQYFTYALHHRKRKEEEATFELENEKRRMIRVEMAYRSAFPK